MVQQNRSLANKEIVLNEAINLLKNVQEHEFRIADIYENTGVSSSVIYSYFRSREGLIDAAFLKMYKTLCEISQDTLYEYFKFLAEEGAPTKFSTKLDHSKHRMHEERLQNRKLRLKISARVVTSTKFANSCKEIHNSHILKLESLFDGLKRDGYISNQFTSSQLVMIYESLSYSWPLFEVIYEEDQTIPFAKLFEELVLHSRSEQ